jgi:signal transduction histidine kinase
MIGSDIERICPVELQAEEAEILAKLVRGQRIDHLETIRLAKNGRRVTVSLTVSPLRDAAGRVIGASNMARETSNREKIEDALRGANETLRIANEVVRQFRFEAASESRATADYLSALDHEIRALLYCIRGFVYLLASSPELTHEQCQYAKRVNAASVTLLTAVDDILDFSKLATDEMELERCPFSLRALLRDTLSIVAPAVRSKNLELTCAIESGVPEWAMGDHGRLRRVLRNLLNNAVKFAELGGAIRVFARPQNAADGRERIFFSVSDTGAGVPIDRQHRLIRPFAQGDNSVSWRHARNGFGLAICKRLIELMDGQIGIVSEACQGATAWFTAYLPCVMRRRAWHG